MTTVHARTGWDPRRADWVAWVLCERDGMDPAALHEPAAPIAWRDLQRVHTPRLLEALDRPDELARVFAMDAWDVPVQETIATLRLVCAGTSEAVAHVLRVGGVALNLAGGYHHASPDRSGGYCAVNDVAVAIAVARANGFQGQIVVIDLDAHPPDGTADCLAADPLVWIGSLSGADWGAIDGADETVLPAGTTDRPYLAALSGLLQRMPAAELAVVLAGGDVLASDRHGALALTLEGARRRDLEVARALEGVPAVWLPAGGYHKDSWRLLATTARVLRWGSAATCPRMDPLAGHFAHVSASLEHGALGGEGLLTETDIVEGLGLTVGTPKRFLGFYTAQGVEYALERFGILELLRRVGYRDFQVHIDATSQGDRCRLTSHGTDAEHLLMEITLEVTVLDDRRALYVHWLTLRHPLAQFAPGATPLPGQDAPGLGITREVSVLLWRIAERLSLTGLVMTPSWFHVAWAARSHLAFMDPARQGRFEALVRDLGHLPLGGLTRAVAEGEVRLNGQPYVWEATDMTTWATDPDSERRAMIDAERDRAVFTMSEGDGPGSATP